MLVRAFCGCGCSTKLVTPEIGQAFVRYHSQPGHPASFPFVVPVEAV